MGNSPRYQFLGELARGGMGAVHRVYDTQLERELAAKVLLDAHQDRPEVVRRFLDEARIQGQLQHPGIAPLHELGQLDDGRLFFAMKLVAGHTLAHHLRERPTPAHELPRWVAVFEQVCQTVAYAHSRGVLHRDLKPLNVMVGAFGEVQVMDWGLAKELASGPRERSVVAPHNAPLTQSARQEDEQTIDFAGPSTDGAAHTTAGTVVGTPAYLAPEQARAEAVDARSDVFGLGAMLCEILTGQPPYAGSGNLLARAGRADLGDARARLDACGADPDLVALARRCLAADPGERPRDARVVADAVASYRHSVAARLRAAEVAGAEAQVKAQEERKRRRVSLALAGAVLVLITGAAGVAFWYQHDRAERQAAEVARFAEVERAARAALDQAAALLDENAAELATPQRAARLVDRAQVWRAALRNADGLLTLAMQRLDELGDRAATELRERFTLLQKRHPVEVRAQALVLQLDQIRLDAATLTEGKFDLRSVSRRYAATFARWGFPILEGDLGTLAQRLRDSSVRWPLVATLDHWASLMTEPELVGRLLHLARSVDPDPWRDRFRTLEAWRDRARLEALALEPATHEQLPGSIITLATLLAAHKGSALPQVRAALVRHPNDFWLHFVLGEADTDAAERAGGYRAALALRPDSVTALNNLGGTLEEQKQTADALACYRRALELAPDHLPSLNNLGVALARQQQYAEAVTIFRQITTLERTYVKGHYNLGRACQDQKQYPAAIAAYTAALDLDPRLVPARMNLGAALAESGNVTKAIAVFEAGLKLDPDNADLLDSLGIAYERQREFPRAVASYRAALAKDDRHANAHHHLAKLLSDRGQHDAALPLHRRAIELRGDESTYHNALGVTLNALRKPADALAAFRQAAVLDPDNADAHYNLGNALGTLGRHDEARACFEKCVVLRPADAKGPFKVGLMYVSQRRYLAALPHLERAVALDRDYAEAYCVLGDALKECGRFPEAVVALRRGHALGSKKSGWTYPSERFLKEAERFVVLDAKIAPVLKEEVAVASAAEQLEYARVCDLKGWYAAAARLYAAGFAADATLEQTPPYRFQAGRVAALAGTSNDRSPAPPNAAEQTRLRQQALAYLRAELARRVQAVADPKFLPAVQQSLADWLSTPAFAGVRDEAALAILPAEERARWAQFWVEVAALQTRKP